VVLGSSSSTSPWYVKHVTAALQHAARTGRALHSTNRDTTSPQRAAGHTPHLPAPHLRHHHTTYTYATLPLRTRTRPTHHTHCAGCTTLQAPTHLTPRADFPYAVCSAHRAFYHYTRPAFRLSCFHVFYGHGEPGRATLLSVAYTPPAPTRCPTPYSPPPHRITHPHTPTHRPTFPAPPPRPARPPPAHHPPPTGQFLTLGAGWQDGSLCSVAARPSGPCLPPGGREGSGPWLQFTDLLSGLEGPAGSPCQPV